MKVLIDKKSNLKRLTFIIIKSPKIHKRSNSLNKITSNLYQTFKRSI